MEATAENSKPSQHVILSSLTVTFCSTADYLDIETEAAGTKFEADDESKNALTTLFEGNQWMIYRNALTGVLHWDFVSQIFFEYLATTLTPLQSVLGRFITFPVVDKQSVFLLPPCIYAHT